MKTLHLFSHFGSSKLPYNVDSLRGFSEWHKTKFRINTNNHKHTTNNKFINQAENHRKEIVMSWCFSVTKIKQNVYKRTYLSSLWN